MASFVSDDRNRAWIPTLGLRRDGTGLYLELTGWAGGAGTPAPTAFIGHFIGMEGFVEDIADAVNLHESTAGLTAAIRTALEDSGTLDVDTVFTLINSQTEPEGKLLRVVVANPDAPSQERTYTLELIDDSGLGGGGGTTYDDTEIRGLITGLRTDVTSNDTELADHETRITSNEGSITTAQTDIIALQERKEVLNDVVVLGEDVDGDVIVATDTGRISTTQQFHHSGTPATATWTNVQVGSTLWGSHRFRGVLGENPSSTGSQDNDIYLHPSRGWYRYESGGFFPARWNGVFIPNLSGYNDATARWVGYRSSQAAATADPQTQNGAYAAYNLILARASNYVAGDPPTTSYDRIDVLNHDDIASVAETTATATTAPTTAAHQIPTLEGLRGALEALPDSGASSFAELTGTIGQDQIASRSILNSHIADQALGINKFGLALQTRFVETGGNEGDFLARVGTDRQEWRTPTTEIPDGSILEIKLSQAVRDLLNAGVEYPTQQEIDDGVETPFTVAVRQIVNDHIQITGFADANRALWDNDSPYRSGNIVRLVVNGEDRFYICTQTHDASDPPSSTPSPDSAAAFGRWVDITPSPVDVLRYSEQTLTDDQKEIARLNIGAGTPNTGGGGASDFSDLTGQAQRSQIANSAIDNTKLATGAVQSLNIATGAVVSTNIASGAVGSTAIGTQAVTEAKLANGAVGSTKLSADVLSSLPPPPGDADEFDVVVSDGDGSLYYDTVNNLVTSASGMHGISIAIVYRRIAATPPTPSGGTQVDGVVTVAPSAWALAAPAGDVALWVSFGLVNRNTNTISWGTPISIEGQDGEDGTGGGGASLTETVRYSTADSIGTLSFGSLGRQILTLDGLIPSSAETVYIEATASGHAIVWEIPVDQLLAATAQATAWQGGEVIEADIWITTSSGVHQVHITPIIATDTFTPTQLSYISFTTDSGGGGVGGESDGVAGEATPGAIVERNFAQVFPGHILANADAVVELVFDPILDLNGPNESAKVTIIPGAGGVGPAGSYGIGLQVGAGRHETINALTGTLSPTSTAQIQVTIPYALASPVAGSTTQRSVRILLFSHNSTPITTPPLTFTGVLETTTTRTVHSNQYRLRWEAPTATGLEFFHIGDDGLGEIIPFDQVIVPGEASDFAIDLDPRDRTNYASTSGRAAPDILRLSQVFAHARAASEVPADGILARDNARDLFLNIDTGAFEWGGGANKDARWIGFAFVLNSAGELAGWTQTTAGTVQGFSVGRTYRIWIK